MAKLLRTTPKSSRQPKPAAVVRSKDSKKRKPGSTKLQSPAPGKPSAARSAREQAAWNKIRGHFLKLFPLTNDGTAAGGLSANLLRIEAGFAFKAAAGDDDFSELHIEPLLDQAADLLDRGVRDRATYDELASRAMLLALDVDSFIQLDAIHAGEEAFGYYDYAADQSYCAYDSTLQAEASYAGAKSRIDGTIQSEFSAARKAELKGASAKEAFVSGVPAYQYDSTPPVYPSYQIYGKTLPVANHAEGAASVQTGHALETEHDSLLVQKDQFELLRLNAELSRPGLQSRMTWDHANRWFARQRTQVARTTNDIKVKSAAEPDGILNFSKRLHSLRLRFRQDFRNALARLKRVVPGMMAVYGYSAPFPTNQADINYFDDCLLWTRAAIDWLVRFSRREQNLVVPVSLRGLLGDAAWSAGLGSGGWSFSLPQSFLNDFAHVRLRGLSTVVIQPEGSPAIWHLVMQIPTAGVTTHLSGQTKTLNQTRVPACHSARVVRRDARRVADTVGVSALHNASPFGNWRTRVLGSATQANLSQLEDVQIDLHLAFRTRAR